MPDINANMSHKQIRRQPFHSSGKRPDLYRRQMHDYDANPMDEGASDHYPDHPYEAGTFITGPLTFTVTRTISPSIYLPSESQLPTTLMPESHSQPPDYWDSPSTVPTPTSSSSQPSRSALPSPSRSSGAVELEPASPQIPEETEASSKSSPLPSGAVIGLIIAGIAITIGLIAYIVRRRYVRRRIELRKEWSRSRSARPARESEFQVSFGERQSSSHTSPAISPFAPPPSSPSTRAPSTQPLEMISRGSPLTTHVATLPLAVPHPPAASYGTEYSPRSSIRGPHTARIPPPTVKKSTNPAQKLLTPVYRPPATVLSKPVTATVVSPLITNLPDELDVAMGDIVHILAEFDDGWAMCLNATRVQGMVPLECLDRTASGHGRSTLGSNTVNRALGGRAKRVSSLNLKLTFSGRF